MIKNHHHTFKINYNDENFKKAFSYIEDKFPNYDISGVNIYVAQGKFLKMVGYDGVGGFFERVNKNIVIADSPIISSYSEISAKITIDEVLVHELIHYVSDIQLKSTFDVYKEEEYAYGNSYDYLSDKGYTDDEVIRNNFMPYFFQYVYYQNPQLNKESIYDSAYKICKNIISYYTDRKDDELIFDIKEDDGFDFLDI